MLDIAVRLILDPLIDTMFMNSTADSAALDRDRLSLPLARSAELRASMAQDITTDLEARLGRTYARQRLGIERAHEQRAFGGGGINYVHIENLRISPTLIRNALRAVGLYGRARRNAADVQVRHHAIRSKRLPFGFEKFTILHISDMHIDMSEGAMRNLAKILPDLKYDICVLTGDYRGKTYAF